MPGRPFRAGVVLLAVPVTVLVGLRADAAPAPAPPAPGVLSLPEGPWPPGDLLAPQTGATPAAVTAAVVNPKCPAPPAGVQHYAPGSGRTVALTFDDGPGPTTMQLLDILQDTGVPATFFNLGGNQATRPALVRLEAALHLALGNHTWDHPRMPALSAAAQAGELDRTSAEQRSLVGPAPCGFRPPYGEYDATTLALARARRMTVWNWSVDTEDWKARRSASAYWVNRIVTRAQAGGAQQHPVILMHNTAAGVPATVLALPRIIAFYRARGYTFVDLAGRQGERAAPAVAVTAAGRHVLVRGADGALRQRIGHGASWSGWRSYGGRLIGGPAAAPTGPDGIAVFCTGTDARVYEKSISDGGAATPWTSLGGGATSRPAAATGPGGRLAVAVRGTDAAAYVTERVGGRWTRWVRLGGELASAPAVAVTADGGVTVAMVGTDRAIWVRHRSGITWAGWHRVGGSLSADPALSASSDGSRLVGLFRATPGAAGRLYAPVVERTGARWPVHWALLSGRLSSGAALAPDGTAMDALGYGTDGRLYLNRAGSGAAGTGWLGWHVLP
jgi:peptidoglycan/xylan/chitin deacetylase (PgdA/CDA1 family)